MGLPPARSGFSLLVLGAVAVAFADSQSVVRRYQTTEGIRQLDRRRLWVVTAYNWCSRWRRSRSSTLRTGSRSDGWFYPGSRSSSRPRWPAALPGISSRWSRSLDPRASAARFSRSDRFRWFDDLRRHRSGRHALDSRGVVGISSGRLGRTSDRAAELARLLLRFRPQLRRWRSYVALRARPSGSPHLARRARRSPDDRPPGCEHRARTRLAALVGRSSSPSCCS